MRTTTIISITLPPKMLAEAERVAEAENRTKSELVREALRRYFLDQKWQQIRAIGRSKARKLGLKPSDVNSLIAEYRTETRTRARRQAKAK